MLAVAVSVDCFSVGITYGLRSIKVGIISLLIISGISTAAIFSTSLLGSGISTLMSGKLGNHLGGLLLIVIGLWIIITSYLELYGQEGKFISFNFKSVKIIIKILKKPAKADFDKSGTINNIEASVLGLALALDAMAVGFGTGLIGYSTFLMPFIVGLTTLIFVSGGYHIGQKFGDILPDHFDMYPGLIIVILGILKLVI